MADTIVKLRNDSPSLVYLCDPVLGDNGKLYVPEALVPIYCEKVIVHATYLTPNSFELSILSGTKVKTEEGVFLAAEKIHRSMNVPCIIVTSSDFEKDNTLVTMIVSNNFGKDRFCVEAPRLPGGFTGSGDLTAALLLAWLNKCDGNVRLACRKAMASVSIVLRNTVKAASDRAEAGKAVKCPLPELELIASVPDLLDPSEQLITMRECN